MLRDRTDGSWSPRSRISFWWNARDTPPAQVPVSVPDCTGTRSWCTDVVTPNFRARSAAGEIFNNPMSKISETRNFISEGPRFAKTISGVVCHGDLLGGPWMPPFSGGYKGTLPSDDLKWLIDDVRTRAISSVKKPDFQGLVSLGELRETLSYLRNPFKTGLKLASVLEMRVKEARSRLRDTTKFDARRRKAIEREIQNLYLEFRYGVRPLIHDVDTFLKALDKADRAERQTFRAKAGSTDSANWVEPYVLGGYTATANFNYTCETTIRAGLLYAYKDSLSLPEKWGGELSEVPSTIWELIPLSFIADWFVNVGTFVRAMTPVSGVDRLSEWTVVQKRETTTRNITGWAYSDWTTVSQGGGTDSAVKDTYYRIPTVGSPQLAFNHDLLAALREPLKVLDLIAIINQRLSGSLLR